MGLEDVALDYDPELKEQFSVQLLERYGGLACRCAEKLEDTQLAKGTKDSYKAQVRQIVSELEDEIPDVEDTVRVIKEQDKTAGSKRVAIHGMRSYYEAIDRHDLSNELDELATNQGIAQKNFDQSMEVEEWITVDEVDEIESRILPDDGETSKVIEGPSRSWNITLEHKALAMTLFYTGCRVGEVVERWSGDEALTLGDLYPAKDQIELYRLKKQGKGYKRDMKVVPQKLWGVLDEYLEWKAITSEDENLFPFVKRTAQNRIGEIDDVYQHFFGGFDHMENLTPHKFRHGRVTQLANANSLDDAGDYVEHSSREITDAYRHIAADRQRSILPEESDDEDSDATIDDLVDQVDGVSDEEELVERLSELDS
jgi:integrase